MHHILSNHLIILLTLCSLCLQGCRSSWQITSEEPALKKARRTSDDEQAPGLVLASYVGSLSVNGDLVVSGGNTSSGAASTEVSLSTGSEEGEAIDTKPAARPSTQGSTSSSSLGRLPGNSSAPSGHFQVNAGEEPQAGDVALHEGPHDVLAQGGQGPAALPEEHHSFIQVLAALREGHGRLVQALEEEQRGRGEFMEEVRALAARLPERLVTLERRVQELERERVLEKAFGAGAWWQYFGDVGREPPLPDNIVEIWNGPCPFWRPRKVKDTHLLVLIPATVDGEPFSLDLLRERVQWPRGGGHFTSYSDDSEAPIFKEFGAQSPKKSYWVLMTRDVLEGSRDQTYAYQQELLDAERRDLPYELPGVLEAVTAILSHYVRSGKRLYAGEPDATDDPLSEYTYTRCREQLPEDTSVVVGGFEQEGGLSLYTFFSGVGEERKDGQEYSFGAAALLRFLPFDTGTEADTD